MLGANASGDGSKPGTGRQNMSCATDRLARHHWPLASRPAVKAGRRGGLHAEAAGDLGHAERIDTVLGHHVGGDTKDLVDRLSAPSRPSV
jgi:hypothetical protein